MTDQALEMLRAFFSNSFRLFTSWNFPGTNVSPAEMFFFLLFVPVALALLSAILGGVFGQYAEDNRLARNEARAEDRFQRKREQINADRAAARKASRKK